MRTFLILLLSLGAISSFSQKHFRKGYILQQGDTVRGMVQYREGQSSLDKCTFQAVGQAEITYRPTDLIGYGFESRHFRSVKSNGQLIFAELIVDGKARLLREGSVFLVQKDTMVVRLLSVTQTVTIDGRQYTKESKAYALQLRKMFSDCPSLPPSYEKMELYKLVPVEIERTFSKIVSKYNACFDTTTVAYKIPRSRTLITWGVEIGAVGTFCSFNLADKPVNATDFDSPLSVSGGLFLDYAYPRISEKLHLRVGVSYQQTKLSGVYMDTNPETENTVNLQYNTIKIPIGLAYNFSTTNFSPYVRGGINVMFLRNQEFTRTKHFTTLPIDDRTAPLLDIGNSKANLFASAGAEIKFNKKHCLFAEFRYESKFNVLDNYSYNSFKVGYFMLSAGIRF